MELAYFILPALFIQLLMWIRAALRPVAGLRIHPLFAKGQCIDCRYSLEGLGQSPRCPECGRLYDTVPTEPSRHHRFRSRLVGQAPAIIVLSAALLAITPLLVRVAYFIPPAAMGFRRDRFWEIAGMDAEFAPTHFIPWIIIVTAPSWLASKRPRRLPVRLIKGWLVSVFAALVFGVIHSRLLWL